MNIQMCETVVATGETTLDGVTVFENNSNREPNEAHHLFYVPAAMHAPGSSIKCTYIEIPQVEHTNAVLLAKPFWIWGTEMGSNEHGVVIGNEAVFSKVSDGKENGLIRMDFLHLGLEQAATMRDALPWHFNQACKGFNHQTGLTSEWDYASENLYKDVLK